MSKIIKTRNIITIGCRYCDCASYTYSRIEIKMMVCMGCGAEWEPISGNEKTDVCTGWRCDSCGITSHEDSSMANDGNDGMCKSCHDYYVEHCDHLVEQECQCGKEADVVKGENGQHGMCSECISKAHAELKDKD